MHTVNKTLLENDIDNHLDIPFGVSATAFHFLQIAGFFANFAGIFPSFVGGVLRFCQALGVGLVALCHGDQAPMTTVRISVLPAFRSQTKAFRFQHKGQCRQIGGPWPDVRETKQDV